MNIEVSNKVFGRVDPTDVETWKFKAGDHDIEIEQFQLVYTLKIDGTAQGRFHIKHGFADSAQEEHELDKILRSVSAPTFRELSDQVHAQEEAEHESRSSWY